MRYFFALSVTLFLANISNAQVNASINLSSQPVWGPTGYDYVEYYYLPDIEAYYNVPQQRYYYYEKGNWIYRSSLPSRYSNYDFYKSYKVVINEREPWHNHKTYRDKYSSYKNRHDQLLIRNSKDSKYFQNKSRPKHDSWDMPRKHDNGRDKGKNQNNNSKKHNNGKFKKYIGN